MTDDEFWSATDQLKLIHEWARARYAAPWAVLGAVLLRVVASTGPHVQLPAVIGGRASLNMMAVFVAPSGGGKGVSDAVARLAWPADIHEEGLGSGQGIAELFKQTKNPEDRIDRAIFSVSEIDHLTSLHEGKANNTRATLKAALMGERIGSKGASAATSRVVPQHTYRMCLSVGGQPGHCGVILDDVSGGMPQRVLWLPGIDPDMPDQPGAEPEPLDHQLPGLLPSRYEDPSTVTEIVYGTDEIAATMIAARLAHSRGEGDPLDGHKALTRAKVAAALAIMAHRTVVDQQDWQLAGAVMDVSSRTRTMVIEHAKQAERAKVRDRAISRATFDEMIDDRHEKTVRSRILRLLITGPKSRSDLRRAMGKQHYREAFDAVLPHLEKICQVITVPGEKAVRYALNPEFTGEPEFTPENTSSDRVNREFTGEPPANVTDLDSRRSHDSDRPKLSCQKWLNHHVEELRAAGHTTVESFAVIEAGQALGYTKGSIHQAVSAHPDMRTVDRKRGRAIWSITPDYKPPRYESADAWLDGWLDNQGSDTVDPNDVKIAGEAAGHNWDSVRRAAGRMARIESIPAHGEARTERIWRVIPTTEKDETA